MTTRVGIRTRLAALVTVVFGVVAGIAALATMSFVEHRLVANTRSNAENVLDNYLQTITNGGQIVATVDPSESAAFFYLDRDGNELTQREYIDTIFAMAPSGALATEATCVGHTGQDSRATQPAGRTLCPPSGTARDPSQATDDQVLAATVAASVVGDVHAVDRDSDTVSVAQRVRFADGTELEIGVSSPLQPVTDSVQTIRTVMWFAVPTLTLAIGLLTYVTVGRALRPVHSITQRTRAITDANLSDRVPVPDRRDDIAELASTMNDMLRRLDAAQQRQRRFVADASHELRSPIAASRAQLEVALAHPDHADWVTTAATVLHEQAHLGDLVDGLLALSRLDEQGLGPTTDVDLAALVVEECERPHRCEVIAVAADPVIVTGNRPQLVRAIRNLIDNADRHAAGTVVATVAGASGRALVHVDDDGPGIPAEERERVLERFTRLDEPRDRDHGGAGLGLAIVHQVARVHDGTVVCTDAPIGGARMTIDLPRRDGPSPVRKVPAASALSA